MKASQLHLSILILLFTGDTLITIPSESKPRAMVSTYINNVGGDPDNKQRMAHLLMCANEVEIEPIIPDYWKGKHTKTG